MTSISAPADPATRFPWAPVLALAASTLWTVTAEMLPAGLLPDIAADTGVRVGTVGYLVTAWGVTIAALSLPLTRLTRRWDRRTLLVATTLVTGTATVLTALAPTYGVVLVFRIVAAAAHGLFWSQVVVVGSDLVTRRAGASRAPRAVAVIVAGPTLASVVLIPALTALGQATSWRAAFGLTGALTVTTGVLLAVVLPRINSSAPPAAAAHSRDRARLVVFAALGALLLVAHMSVYTFVSPVLTGRAGLARSEVSIALLVFGVAGALGLVAAPALVARMPSHAMVVTGAGLAGSLALLGVVHVPAGALAAMAAWGLVLGVLPVVFQIRMLGLASEAFRPTAGAIMVVALNLGMAGGGAAGSLLEPVLGPAPLPLVAAGLAAAATFGVWVASRRR